MKTQKHWVLVVVYLLLAGILAHAQEASPKPITIGETLRIASKKLNETREIRVYLPTSYANSKQRYPVIYTLDGEGTGSVTANAVEFMTGYSLLPQMPEALVVGVTNADRNRDMPIPQEYGKGGEENFLAFLADELIPAIEQRYRTQPLRILLGHSQGGLFATYALTARPTVFQWYLSMDAPLAGFPEVKPMMEKAKTVITKTPNYHGRLVTIENLYGWRKEWASLVEAAPKGFYGAQVEIKDETHETMAYKGIYEGLKRLFHDYAPNIVKETKGIYTLPTLDEMYRALSKDYGYQVDIPKQLLLASATRNTAMQYGAEAVELVKRVVALYGESPATKRLMADAEEAVKKGRDPRFEEWANLPPPSVEQMKPFLGTWERTGGGAHWFMTFEIKDGVVRAQCTVNPPNGESFEVVVHFVRVLEDKTVQWGERNGRGPGVNVFTAKLVDGDKLVGSTEPVGFIHGPPPGTFTFNRKVNDKKSSPNHFDEDAKFAKVSFSVTPQSPLASVNRKEITVGAAAPDWRLKTVEGETIALSALRGKVVVLDFWAHWCGPCQKLTPLFDQLVREYQGKPVKFFTLSVRPGQDFNPQAFLKEHQMASTFLIGDGTVADNYDIWGLPTYYVIDPTGKVSYIHVLLSVDPEALGKRLREAIEKALPKEQDAQSRNLQSATVRDSSQESDRSRNRDAWQRPAEVFDALGVKPGQRVADIGSGFGYFTFRLAARVGAEGKVYAVDIDPEAIKKVRERKEREKLEQVEPILGESNDPHLPNDLNSVLIVDSYHELREYDQTMQAVFRALKIGGRLVIIDGEAPSGRPRTEYHRLHSIPAELVREEVAHSGFVFKESRPGFYDAEYGKKMYFLIFEKP